MYTSYPKFYPLAFLIMSLFCGLVSAGAETTSTSGATPITSLPFPITASGTYYLSQDLPLHTDTAYAISITAANVTLDLNGHTISQDAGLNSSTLGVYINANNVTVRNGTVSGCLYGSVVHGNNCLLENLLIVSCTYAGAEIDGASNTIRHCRVNNTGGETVPNLAPYALGISGIYGSNLTVLDCDVTTLTPGPNCYTACILLGSVQNALVVNNRLSAATWGAQFFNCTGKYRDNLCAPDVGSTYGSFSTTVIDAGNNQ